MRPYIYLSFIPLVVHIPVAVASPAAWEPSCHGGLVDLGYAKHVPTFTNTTSTGRKVAIYKNIRFANPPTGDLRFRKPNTKLPRVSGVKDGNMPWASTDCISSAHPAVPFPGLNGTTWGQEDCLFLDVYVPETVKPHDKVPVLHFFFGSAYAFGSKDIGFNPMGLFDGDEKENKFIFVVNNYRLGVPGWTNVAGEDLDANVGMHDCIAAAEWTSKYIGRFGGDPSRVTVIGQSAGAGIAQLSTVLDGGKRSLPYQQVVVSSPGIPPRKPPGDRHRQLFNKVLGTANCTSLDCLRSIPEASLREINDLLINRIQGDSGGGVFGPAPGFGPAPDGLDIPDMPEALYREGRYNKNLNSLMIGNMANEGMYLSHDTDMPGYFPTLVRQIIPSASDGTIETLQSQYDWQENPARLAWDWTTDVIFGCNAYNLARAYGNEAHRYIMSTPPAIHGYDLWHFFYIDQQETPVGDPALAREFQHRLLQFVHGNTLDWPKYGKKQNLFNVTESSFEKLRLPDDFQARCDLINHVMLADESWRL